MVGNYLETTGPLCFAIDPLQHIINSVKDSSSLLYGHPWGVEQIIQVQFFNIKSFSQSQFCCILYFYNIHYKTVYHY